MTLLAAEELQKERFFREGDPRKRASSFDLTVGSIFNDDGQEIEGSYVLQPNEMVQVTSAEVFDLPNDVTAHVSYKTSMTHKGIWALTVGVVDPGWDCPVSTTLFNFSKVPFPISKGDAFLRVSLFKHLPVPGEELQKGPNVQDYNSRVRRTAVTTFGRQFLNADRVAEDAGKVAMSRMRNSALTWVALIAFIFTVLQLLITWGPPAYFEGPRATRELESQIDSLQSQLADLKKRVTELDLSDATDRNSGSAQNTEAPAELDSDGAAGKKAEDGAPRPQGGDTNSNYQVKPAGEDVKTTPTPSTSAVSDGD